MRFREQEYSGNSLTATYAFGGIIALWAKNDKATGILVNEIDESELRNLLTMTALYGILFLWSILRPYRGKVYMRKVMPFLLLLLIFSSVAEGSNWQFVAPLGSESYGFYVDFDTVRKLPQRKVRFWYSAAKTLEDAKKDTGRRHDGEMTCLHETFRDITYEQAKAPVVWEHIAPDSFQESFYEVLCRRKK